MGGQSDLSSSLVSISSAAGKHRSPIMLHIYVYFNMGCFSSSTRYENSQAAPISFVEYVRGHGNFSRGSEAAKW